VRGYLIRPISGSFWATLSIMPAQGVARGRGTDLAERAAYHPDRDRFGGVELGALTPAPGFHDVKLPGQGPGKLLTGPHFHDAFGPWKRPKLI
jgi:hypothetical protein